MTEPTASALVAKLREGSQGCSPLPWHYTSDVGEGSGAPGVIAANDEIVVICHYWPDSVKDVPHRAEAEGLAKSIALAANHIELVLKALEASTGPHTNSKSCARCQALAAVADAAKKALKEA
jgi:hypothetical protein